MKKIYFTFIIISLIIDSVQAQQNSSPVLKRWNVGVIGSVNYPFLRVNNTASAPYKPHIGYQAGIDIAYRLNSRMALHGQPMLERVTSPKNKSIWQSPTFDFTMLTVPITYRYYVLPSHKSLFVEAGISYNRLIKSMYQGDYYVICDFGPCSLGDSPYNSALTKSAVSGIAGLGIDIALQKVTIPITLRYERYLSNYLFSGSYPFLPNTPVQFETVTLMTGVSF